MGQCLLLSPFQQHLYIGAKTTPSPMTGVGQSCHLCSVISSTDERMAFRFAAGTGAAQNRIRIRFSSAVRLLPLEKKHVHTPVVETPADRIEAHCSPALLAHHRYWHVLYWCVIRIFMYLIDPLCLQGLFLLQWTEFRLIVSAVTAT